MCLLQRAHPGQMCNSPGQNVAPEALLLYSMRKYFRRRGLSRTRRETLLSGGLLQHVCSKMCRLQFTHYGELHLCPQRPVAPRMLRVQGLPSALQWRVLLRSRRNALLRDSLPCQARLTVRWVQQAHHRTLHHCYVPQVSSRAFCMLLLPQTAQQGHIQRTERQTLLSCLLRQTLWIRKPHLHLRSSCLGRSFPSYCSPSPQDNEITNTTWDSILDSGRDRYSYSSVNIYAKFTKNKRGKKFHSKYNTEKYHAFAKLHCSLVSNANRYYIYFPHLYCSLHYHCLYFPCNYLFFSFLHYPFSYIYLCVHNHHICHQSSSPYYHYYLYSIYRFKYFPLLCKHVLCSCYQLLPCLLFKTDFVISYLKSVLWKHDSNSEITSLGRNSLLIVAVCLRLKSPLQLHFLHVIYILLSHYIYIIFFRVHLTVIGALKVISSMYVLMLISVQWLKHYLIHTISTMYLLFSLLESKS